MNEEYNEAEELRAIEERARKYHICDIVASAALIGMEYGRGFDEDTAAGLILCNDISLVKRALDQLEDESAGQDNRGLH